MTHQHDSTDMTHKDTFFFFDILFRRFYFEEEKKEDIAIRCQSGFSIEDEFF